ncbi:MAG: hypothetical protein ACXAC7_06785 [Candidatus Hodarchaeales archaeon]|jgi:hypothetical protein
MSVKRRHERAKKAYKRYKRQAPFVLLLAVILFFLGNYISEMDSSGSFSPDEFSFTKQIGSLTMGLSLIVGVYFGILLFGMYMTKAPPLMECPNCGAVYPGEMYSGGRCLDCNILLTEKNN